MVMMTKSRNFLRSVLFTPFLGWNLHVSDASISTGFTSKEIPPQLEDLPNNIGELVRELSSSSSSSFFSRTLQKEEEDDDDEEDNIDLNATFIPIFLPMENATFVPIDFNKKFVPIDFNETSVPSPPEDDGEGLSYAILMDEFGYSSDPIVIGTRFAFSGRLASTEEGEVGKASGTCTIGSDLNTDFSLCTFYLTLMEKQDKGMIALTGNTDSVGGYLQVTATGGNLRTHSQGTANLAYDPAGNPILYLLIRFSSSSTSSM